MKLLKSVKSRSRSDKKLNAPVVETNNLENAESPTAQSPEPSPAAPIPPSTTAQQDTEETRQDAPDKKSATTTPPPTQLRPLRLGSFDFESSNGYYTYPSLFEEADDMIKLSNLMYTLAELRDLARNGVLSNPTKSFRILQLPLPMETAMIIIGEEAELLKEVLSDGKHAATLSALQSLLDRQTGKKEREAAEKKKKEEGQKSGAGGEGQAADSDSMFGGWMDSWNGCLAGGFSFDELFCGGDLGMIDGGNKAVEASEQQGREEVESSMIVAVGDLKCKEELVYAVGINPTQERITVAFRGSVTKNDFVTDARINLIQAPDPRSDSTDQVGIHQGFFDYLFGGTEKGKQSKYAEIMSHVQKLFDENPSRRKNYKLYVTGHSLGGALATLFGFYASASTLPLPVTIVSVASPRVGNLEFARTFTEFESQGKIRHLRIANHKDPVTLGPTVSTKKALTMATKTLSPLGYLALRATGNDAREGEIYYHTGIKMKLRKEVEDGAPRCELSYSGASIVSGSSAPDTAEEDLDVMDESGKKKSVRRTGSVPGMQDVPLVAYHYGSAYRERMELVESELAGLTLNNLYREKTIGK